MPDKRRLFFNEFLVKKGLVSDEMAFKALARQREGTPRFDDVALKMGLLDYRQVLSMLNDQKTTRQSPEEICLRKGYLSPEQVTTVLQRIERDKPKLSEILVQMGAISQQQLDASIKDYYEMYKRVVLLKDTLLKFDLFRGLNDEDLENLAYIAEESQVAAGARVIKENDPADNFYCVEAGFLRVTKNHTEKPGEEIFISSLGPGDVFGESSIFEEEHRTANVTAETECSLLCFDRGRFIAFLRDHAQASQPVLVFIIKRLLAKLNTTNRELAFERRNFITHQDEIDEVLRQFR